MIGVVSRELMTMPASISLAAPHIDALSDGLQMCGIATNLVAAKVINDKTISYRASCQFIRNPMG